MSIADRIREARKAKGMTQAELGKLIGQTAGAITNYERGTREPNVIQIKKIASALGVTGDWLIESEWAYQAEEEKLTYFFRELNDEGKRALLSTAEAYTKIESYIKKQQENTKKLG